MSVPSHRRLIALFVRRALLATLTASAAGALAEEAPRNSDADVENVLVTGSQDALGGYTQPNSRSATKLDLELKDTPQSITVFTAQQIQDQNLTSTDAILAQTPGVSKVQYGQQGAGYASYYSRGFEITNVLRDGVPTTAASFGGSDMLGLEDSAIYQRVEVVRGSTGLTSGTGNPSASINYVRKRPTEEFVGTFKVQGGSWNTYRGQLDVSNALNDDGSIRGRFIAVYEQGDGQQERYHHQNSVAYGALDFDLGASTTLTTALTLQTINVDDATTHGFPFITKDNPPQRQDLFDSDDNPAADYTYSDTEKLNLFLGLEHAFNDNWTGVANYAYTDAENDRVYGVAGSGGIVFEDAYASTRAGFELDPGEMVVTSGRFTDTPKVHSLDLYTTGKFTAFGREHQLVAGANGYSIESDDPNYARYFIPTQIDGWNGQTEKPDFAVTGRSIVDEQQIGAFSALYLQLADPLKLIVGARVSNWERKVTDAEQKESGVTTPYAGLIYDITDNIAAYASYTSIFNPSASQDVNGNYLDPQEGNSAEFGFKAAFYDGKLNASIARFEMRQDNFAIADGDLLTPEGGQAYITVDGAEVEGYEITIAGQLMPNWNIQAGYTSSDARGQDGGELNTRVPDDTLSLFSSYAYGKLTFGGGINWQSEFYENGTTGLAARTNRQDNFYLVNLMLRYAIQPDLTLGLNVANLLDEEYKLNPFNSWGTGRQITASLNHSF